MFTSDILRICEDGQWIDRCKAGRREELIDLPDLPVILRKEGPTDEHESTRTDRVME
jgi:hypothetical protein